MFVSVPSPRLSLPLTLSLCLLAGCSATTAVSNSSVALVTGNWQVASAASTRLPSFSGELAGTSAAITGIFHSNAASACVAPTSSFAMQGSVKSGNVLTLTGSGFQGGTLTLTGTLATDGKSLTNASYSVSGGSCAFAAATSAATAQTFSPITGTFTGSFADTSGQTTAVTANLSQSPASDPNGDFTLSGNATFPNDPCFSSPVAISGSQVTGGSFTVTYTDSVTQNVVTANGTFAPSGTMLNVTSWVSSGPCGPDNGTGTLSR